MPASLSIPANKQTDEKGVALIFKHADGTVILPPADGGSVVSSDLSIVTATLAANDGSVDLRWVAAGAAVVTYANTNGNISDTLDVTCLPAVEMPASVAFDTTNVAFVPNA
jgi:hypothetical protein